MCKLHKELIKNTFKLEEEEKMHKNCIKIEEQRTKKEKLSKKIMKSKRWIKNYDNMKLLVETEAKLNEM